LNFNSIAKVYDASVPETINDLHSYRTTVYQ
jgi:hypothetical protein